MRRLFCSGSGSRRLIGIAATCAWLAMLGGPLPAASFPRVRTGNGWIQGIYQGPVEVYRGIPYAAPPVGPLRWRPPEPAARWTGVRPAREFSASCMQQVQHQLPWTAEYNIGPPYSEDCLYLNVWGAAASDAERRPVLFFIHGGGFMVGSGSVPIYDGTDLARKGLVVITANYRLGVFGFFADDALAAESPNHSTGDYGMLDLVAALRWVHRNVAAFGGDPNNVTIAGQSAGAAAAHFLTKSPLGQRLFQRVIAESGSAAGGDHGRSLARAEQQDAAWAASIGAPSLAQLRALPAAELESKEAATHKRFGPVDDGWFLPLNVPGAPVSRASDVPTMTGMTADDIGTGWLGDPATPMAFRHNAEERLGTLASQFLALYPAVTNSQASAAAKQAGRDRMAVSMYLWALERSRTEKTPVYTYYFSRVTPGAVGARFGAFHASDLPCFFDNLHESPRPWTPLDRHLASVMSSYWVQFARTGNPNGGGLPLWAAFTPSAHQTMELGAYMGPRPLASPARFEFFNKELLMQQIHQEVRQGDPPKSRPR